MERSNSPYSGTGLIPTGLELNNGRDKSLPGIPGAANGGAGGNGGRSGADASSAPAQKTPMQKTKSSLGNFGRLGIGQRKTKK